MTLTSIVLTGPSIHRQGQIGLLDAGRLCSLLLVSHQRRYIVYLNLFNLNKKNTTRSVVLESSDYGNSETTASTTHSSAIYIELT